MNHTITIPNLITAARLVLVPVVIVAISEDRLDLAFWLFLLAGLSDGIDGYIARHWNQQSELGAHLDPVADKALLIGIFVTLGIEAIVPRWLVIIIVSRDVLIVGAVILSWVMGRKIVMRPSLVSKVNTAGQIGLAALFLAQGPFGFEARALLQAASIVVAGLTIASGCAYLWTWLNLMSHHDDAKA